ncbi:MAG: DUF2169 domain-containing protein [Planctomycetes bacterium]|nr:DUF2169 domain-containing protein [Planctomycetota bacterium]
MDIDNVTGMQAAYTLGLAPDGRESAVVLLKGTYLIPSHAKEPAKLAPEQQPLIAADLFTGEPGFSAALYETDYAPRKLKCDVLLNGSAYAPKGQSAERVTVRLRVGSVNKSFDVIGKRTYRGGVLGLSASPTEKFSVLPFSYNVAFGGTDKTVADPAAQKTYLLNHVGVGYHENMNAQAIVGQPLPNTEETGKPVNNPRGSYRPMAFGPVGRAWQSRIKWAGTYDQKWLDDVFPFLPKDFDERYYQAAPEDQQTDYLHGGEEVELVNLTPAGRTVFQIPTFEMPVVFLFKNTERIDTVAACDTLLIEPDLGRFSLTWRASCRVRRNLMEIDRAVIGPMSKAYFRAYEMGKPYYRSIREYVLSEKEDAE